MRPIVQVSLDLTSTEEALAFAEVAVRAGVDWLEAGTPLILAEGLHAVRALHERFPHHPIVADLKTMDGGYLETEMMAKAGAAMTVVMGLAHRATIRGAVQAARDYGIKVMGDVMLHPDKAACARMMQELGVDYVIVHTGYDERRDEVGRSPLDDLPAVRRAVTVPIQAVGGLSVEQAIATPALGAELVVIGAPLFIDGEEFKPGAPEEKLEELLRHICTEVHAKELWDAGGRQVRH